MADTKPDDNQTAELWGAVRRHLRGQLGVRDFETWVAPLSLSEEDGRLVVLAPNQFFINWLQERYMNHLRVALSQVGRKNAKLEFRVDAQAMPQEPEPAPETDQPEDDLAGSPLNPMYTFANFVVGNCNELAHAACWSVAQQPGSHYNPLFLFGGAGLGKTHLLTAVGNYILQRDPKKRVRYCSCEVFTNELIQAVRFDQLPKFQARHREVDCLLIDDVQFLGGRERTQEEFFHTFNALFERGKQIILTSDKPPREIAGLERRLCTRFESGLLCDLQPPDEETTVAILQRKSAEKGLELSRQVATFLARQPETSVRILEGYLNRILAVSSFQGVEVTLELASRVVGPLMGERRVSVEEVLKAVAARYGMRVAELKGESKTRKVTHPRQVAMYLARRLTRFSFPEIGRALGGKDHSTVVKGVKKIEALMGQQPELAEEVRELERALLGGGMGGGVRLSRGGI